MHLLSALGTASAWYFGGCVVFFVLSLLYAKLILRPGRVIQRRFADSKMHSCVCGDVAVDIVFDQVYRQAIYFRNAIQLPVPNLGAKRTPIVVDVGGNVGFFSEQVAQKCPDAEIHTVEPIPELAQCCRANVARYLKSGKHHMHQIAIGDKDDVPLELRYDSLMTSASTAHFDEQFKMGFVERTTAVFIDSGRNQFYPQFLTAPLAAVRTVPVVNAIVLLATTLVLMPFFLLIAAKSNKRQVSTKTATLSTLLAAAKSTGPIDLLKIDCEMAEWACVQGIAAADWARIQQVVIEVHGTARTKECRALLESKGFKHFAVDDEDDYLLLQAMDIHTLYAKR